MAEQISDATFDSVVLNSDIPVLLDFWAPWCGPCRAVGPIIDELAAEYEGKVRIVKMNVDENPATPTKFGIRAIPTLMLFKNGQAIDQVTGAVNKDAIVNILQTRPWHELLRCCSHRQWPCRGDGGAVSRTFRLLRHPF